MFSRGIKPPKPTKKWRVGKTAVKMITPGTFLLCDTADSGEHFQDPPELSGSVSNMSSPGSLLLDTSSSPPPGVSSSPPPGVSSTPPPGVSSTPPLDVSSSPPPDVSISPPPGVSRSPPLDASSSPPPGVFSSPSSGTSSSSPHDGSSSSLSDNPTSSKANKNRPSTYNTKSRNVQKKKEEMSKIVSNYEQAVLAFQNGEFTSERKCAQHFNVPRTTLQRLLKNNLKFVGTGKKSKVFTSEEESKIINFVVNQQEIGCGLSWYQLQLLLQEVMQSLKIANSSRITGYKEHNNLPNMCFVRRFATRHSLTLRKSLEISKGRAICSVADLENWQADTIKYLLESDKFAECFSDPRRIWNQDESSIECGISG